MKELKDCIEFLEHAYTGARAMDNVKGMERLQNALFILEHGLDRFLEELAIQENQPEPD